MPAIDLDAVVEQIWEAAEETLAIADPGPFAYPSQIILREARAEAEFKQCLRAILEEVLSCAD